MHAVRTPDERFADLPDFPYLPRYVDVPAPVGDPLRMAWVEDGPPDAEPVLLLHGEPTWSFLYRHMIPPLAAAGLRVIAPDLIGFGRSDKPTDTGDHTYARHVEWVRYLVEDVLDLRRITLVGQDWGGLIGLRLAAEHPERFARIVAANTGLPTGDHPMPEVWHRFKDAMQNAAEIDVARFVRAGCRRAMADEVLRAYNAPFPGPIHQAGPRALPGLVPITPDDPATDANRAAWKALTAAATPALIAFSDGDPITAAMGPILQRALPGAQGRTHPTIEQAGHFLQEDAGPDLAAAIITFVRDTPLG